jgi:hypothetical protein
MEKKFLWSKMARKWEISCACPERQFCWIRKGSSGIPKTFYNREARISRKTIIFEFIPFMPLYDKHFFVQRNPIGVFRAQKIPTHQGPISQDIYKY